VNESEVDFAVVEGKIRFGLNAVKNVGEAACRAIVAARQEGPFASLWDFVERVDPQVVNRRALESLVKCGALDSLGHTRSGMLGVLDAALAYGQQQHADRIAGQGSIFDLDETPAQAPRHHPAIPDGEFEKSELLRLEKETLGVFVSEHPLHSVRDQLRRRVDTPLGELERRRDGEALTVGGIVSAVKALTTKRAEPMVFLRLDDFTGSAEVVVFNSVYAASRELLETDRILVIKGRVDHKQEGETKLIAMEVAPFDAVETPASITLRIDARKAPAGIVRDLSHIVGDFPGEARVVLAVETSEGPKVLELGEGYRVSPVPDFYAEVKALLGEAAVL
jgi:DNA polymerase-3 subunit alpha